MQQLYNSASRAPRASPSFATALTPRDLATAHWKTLSSSSCAVWEWWDNQEKTHCLLKKELKIQPKLLEFARRNLALLSAVSQDGRAELRVYLGQLRQAEGSQGLHKNRDSLCPGSSPLPLTLLIYKLSFKELRALLAQPAWDATASGGGTWSISRGSKLPDLLHDGHKAPSSFPGWTSAGISAWEGWAGTAQGGLEPPALEVALSGDKLGMSHRLGWEGFPTSAMLGFIRGWNSSHQWVSTTEEAQITHLLVWKCANSGSKLWES